MVPTLFFRHVGDLGNIEANAQGEATINIEDSQVSICGPHSVVGRTIVVRGKTGVADKKNWDTGSPIPLP